MSFRRETTGRAWLCSAAFGLLLQTGGCSIFNREGRDLSCEELGNGAFNVCHDGIVTSCESGEIEYNVCDKESACEASWQIEGAFRCEETHAIPGSDPDESQAETPTPRSMDDETFPACGWSFERSACASCVVDSCCMTAQNCADEAPCTSCATRTPGEAQCLAELLPTYEAFLECQRSCGCQ